VIAGIRRGVGRWLAWVALAWIAPSSASPPADLVFLDGVVYTGDAARSWAEALAVNGKRISYVGPTAGARRLIGPGTQVIDLHQRMLMPAFQDSHVHPGMVLDPAVSLNLAGLNSRAEISDAVRRFAAKHPRHVWIVGDGWDKVAFLPSGMPTRGMLDQLVPARPSFITDNSGHSAWVNSRALELAGIDDQTPDPPNGSIERDANGHATGMLHEDSAMELVQRRVPAPTAAETGHQLSVALQQMRAAGFTALEDAMATDAIAAAFKRMDDAGTLNMRVNLCLPHDPARGDDAQIARFLSQRKQLAGRLLRAPCVKIFVDGAIAGHGLALLQPYSDDARFGRGRLFVEPDRLAALTTRLDAAGFQVHMHAQGDWAVRAALDAFEAALRHNGRTDHRHTIAHLWVVDPTDIPRFRALGVIANMTPRWSLGDTWQTVDAPLHFGAERMQHLFPGRSLLDAGAMMVWGSDWPVTGVSSMEGLEVAITHRYPGGRDPQGSEAITLIPAERVNLTQAIAAYTSAGAYFMHDEAQRGTLTAGKLADLVVLDRNPFEVRAAEIHDIKVDLTTLGGKIVFRRQPR
jgi:predicted amidohydrolase YtcJ